MPSWLYQGETVQQVNKNGRPMIEVTEHLYHLLTYNWHLKTLEDLLKGSSNMDVNDAKQLYNILRHLRTLLKAQPGY